MHRAGWQAGEDAIGRRGIETKNVPPPPPLMMPDSPQHWSLNPESQQTKSSTSMQIKIRFFKVESASREQILVTRRKINRTAFMEDKKRPRQPGISLWQKREQWCFVRSRKSEEERINMRCFYTWLFSIGIDAFKKASLLCQHAQVREH